MAAMVAATRNPQLRCIIPMALHCVRLVGARQIRAMATGCAFEGNLGQIQAGSWGCVRPCRLAAMQR